MNILLSSGIYSGCVLLGFVWVQWRLKAPKQDAFTLLVARSCESQCFRDLVTLVSLAMRLGILHRHHHPPPTSTHRPCAIIPVWPVGSLPEGPASCCCFCRLKDSCSYRLLAVFTPVECEASEREPGKDITVRQDVVTLAHPHTQTLSFAPFILSPVQRTLI